jgi:hypothetical protein
MNKVRWQDFQLDYLRAHYADTPMAEITAFLQCSEKRVWSKASQLGLHRSPEFLRVLQTGLGKKLSTSPRARACRFSKDKTPWNKGIHVWTGGDKTWFKKGELHGRALELRQPVGATRIFDGYLQQKITNDIPFHKRWKGVHILTWEAAHGAVPKGFVIKMKDGNKLNTALENLECISRRELMLRNSAVSYGPEIFNAIRLRGSITRVIKNLKKKEEENHVE